MSPLQNNQSNINDIPSFTSENSTKPNVSDKIDGAQKTKCENKEEPSSIRNNNEKMDLELTGVQGKVVKE